MDQKPLMKPEMFLKVVCHFVHTRKCHSCHRCHAILLADSLYFANVFNAFVRFHGVKLNVDITVFIDSTGCLTYRLKDLHAKLSNFSGLYIKKKSHRIE